MAIFAHPDDVDFGCSGTLASWIGSADTHVTYCVITSGQKGTHDPRMTPEQMAGTREAEQRAAGAVIGVREFVFLRHQDGELERTMALREQVCLVIRQHKPELVLTNDPWGHYQTHPDHRVARVLLFGTRDPNIWFDISATLDQKLAALRSHRSQVGGRAGFSGRMRGWAKTIGATWDLPAAEAFRYIELG